MSLAIAWKVPDQIEVGPQRFLIRPVISRDAFLENVRRTIESELILHFSISQLMREVMVVVFPEPAEARMRWFS